MALIGVYADPHFSINSSIALGKGTNGFSNRLNNLIESFEWMNNLFNERNVELVICLGDLTDRAVLSAEEITALSLCGLENHHFIVGNHCRSDKNGRMNALSIFKNVYHEPHTLTVDGKKIHLLPYNSDLYDLPEDVDIICSHNDIKNYNFGTFLSPTGYEQVDILKSCRLFINGHLHNGGWVVKDRIVNLGAMVGINFSSCGGEWEPSIGIIDTDTLKLEIIENPVAYRFKKLDCPTLQELKNYLDQLPSVGQYIIQVKTSAELAENCRKLLTQTSKVVASRILTYSPTIQQQPSDVPQKVSADDTSANVYEKFKAFLKEQSTLKFDLSNLLKIIDDLAVKGNDK